MTYTQSQTREQQMSPPPRRRTGINLGTLVAAAVGSVVAAMVVSRLWQAGTVMATAMTPVIVALVKEAVERPAQRVSSIAARSGPRSAARIARVVAAPPPEAEAPPPPVVVPNPGLTEMRVYGRERMATGRRWKLALVTGLLAFGLCVAVLTLPELVAGHSVVSTSHDTTIFGGHRTTPPARSKPKQTTSTQTTTTQKTDTTKTDTQPQGTTTTTPGQTQPAPAAPPTAAPQTQPPAQTTPAPPPPTTAPPAGTPPTTP
jgi:hypothetical protein